MKNQIFKITFMGFAVLCFAGVAKADTAIHLSIKTPSSTLYDKDITVVPCNSDNGATANVLATPYCAVLQSGLANDWSWFGAGAFLNSINGIKGFTTKDSSNNDVFHFWDWSQNGTEGTVGMNEYTLQPSDLISLDFIDPPSPVIPSGTGPLLESGASVPLTPSPVSPLPAASPVPAVVAPPAVTPAVTLPPVKPVFDTKKAFQFLTSEQNGDGAFGEDLYTDWTALAFASGNYQDQAIKLVKYFGNAKVSGIFLTDFERHAMALLSLGLNPYNTNGGNYIEKIVAGFDGKQFGDIHEDNDDIFALIVLQNAGYGVGDKMINDDISFVLGAQMDNGSWDNSVDMTGAAIESISAFNQNEGAANAMTKAENFLKLNQKENGGWNNNASSTAWALEGILAMNEKPEDWKKGDNTPLDYLGTTQDTDGGVKDESINNKIWETAYVTSALSGKTWNQLMQKFEKPQIPEVIKIKTPKKLLKTQAITASVINTVTPPPAPAQTETPKKNWFSRLLDSIFGSFR